MRPYDTIAHRAFDQARRLKASLAPPRRWPLTFALMASLFASALGPPPAAVADAPPDPAARLQVIIHKILVRHDRDFIGSGEMHMWIQLCPAGGAAGSCPDGTAAIGKQGFSAGDGDTKTLERVMPRDGDDARGETSYDAGVPVYAGQHLTFTAGILENDPFGGDDMGYVAAPVDEEHNWGIGTFTTYSTGSDDHLTDFQLTYEIRRTPLPELLNRGIHIINGGDGQFYCVTVQNIGEQTSPSVPIAVRVDGTLLRAPVLGPLDATQSTEHCVLRTELPPRQVMLSFMVDEGRQIPEMDEADNFYQWKIPAVGATVAAPGAAPSPQPSIDDSGAAPSPKPSGAQTDPSGIQAGPSGEKPDLTVRAIRVNDQAPDGKDDCKVGKNAVAVVVKNAGKGDAARFAMRLSVDGNASAATVDGLDAGQEREVRFDNVQLKAGAHTLTAAADTEDAVAELKEDNNELKVTARCQGSART